MYRNSYLTSLTHIHRYAINTQVTGYRTIVVLGGRPPLIADGGSNMPRKTKVVLAQLRSRCSSRLDAYLSRIDRAIPNSCPACCEGPHDNLHF